LKLVPASRLLKKALAADRRSWFIGSEEFGESAFAAATDGTAGIRPAVPLVVSIDLDDAAWDYSVFSKNPDRLLEGDMAAKLLAAVLARPKLTASVERSLLGG
jgi:hypothetical protein